MTMLRELVAAAGERLVRASSGKIRFDPDVALSRDASLGLRPPGQISANGHSRLVEAADGWLAVTLARPEDSELLPAWTGEGADAWATLRQRPVRDSVADATYLHLPVARAGEAMPLDAQALLKGGSAAGEKVVDLSALWAGPACGGHLADAGLSVTRIESSARPDPTARHAPELDARLNGRKSRMMMDTLNAQILDVIADARVLITSARPHALARMGLPEARVFDANPCLLWIAITAHGWRGDAAMRVGFGDDCAAAGNLVAWESDGPVFIGDALADPLTGIMAATLALEALDRGEAGLLDMPLARVAASFAAAMR